MVIFVADGAPFCWLGSELITVGSVGSKLGSVGSTNTVGSVATG